MKQIYWASGFNRKSTSGFVYFLAGGAISWGSRQQKCVAHSSAESEYVALSGAGKECIWLRRVVSEMLGSIAHPTLVYEDNQACALWCTNPIQHSRQKHIDIAHHAIRDWVADKIIAVKYVSTHDQLADLLTKNLQKDAHRRMMYLILGNNPDALRQSQMLPRSLPGNLYDPEIISCNSQRRGVGGQSSRALLGGSVSCAFLGPPGPKRGGR